MKKRYLFLLSPLICLLVFLVSCQKEDPPGLSVPGDDWIIFITFELQNIDSARYWGDSDKIRLQSGIIMLNPDNGTYFKKFIGTITESLDPAEIKWSKEESGKYIFSIDSTYILFSNDPYTVFYFRGYWSSGIYHQPRMEKHDSIWYSNFNFSMGISGRFEYSGKPD
jgi:hypothetical protein